MAELADQVINTKVTQTAKDRLKAICQQYDFSLFDMLQMLCDCLIRFMDEYHNLDESLLRIIRMFEGLQGWDNAFRVTEPFEETDENEEKTSSVEIMEAFYVLKHHKHNGEPRVLHVIRPMMDGDAEGWQVNENYRGTFNIQGQFERFMEVMFPKLYKYLRWLADSLETESLYDAIYMLGDKYKENPLENDLRKLFEEMDWHKGARMYDRTQYKRGYNRSEQSIEAQQQKLFDND